MAIPSNPYVNGTCGQDTNTLNLFFNNSWCLTFTFTNSSKTKKVYQMDNIVLNYVDNLAWFPNMSSTSGKKPNTARDFPA